MAIMILIQVFKKVYYLIEVSPVDWWTPTDYVGGYETGFDEWAIDDWTKILLYRMVERLSTVKTGTTSRNIYLIDDWFHLCRVHA